MYDKYSGRSRRFAFVTMKTVDDANAVIEKLNGTVILTPPPPRQKKKKKRNIANGHAATWIS